MEEDREQDRQDHIWRNLKATMEDGPTRIRIFNALCGVPIAANQARMMMAAVDGYLHPKAKA